MSRPRGRRSGNQVCCLTRFFASLLGMPLFSIAALSFLALLALLAVIALLICVMGAIINVVNCLAGVDNKEAPRGIIRKFLGCLLEIPLGILRFATKIVVGCLLLIATPFIALSSLTEKFCQILPYTCFAALLDFNSVLSYLRKLYFTC